MYSTPVPIHIGICKCMCADMHIDMDTCKESNSSRVEDSEA